jgi:hypothetical protein
MVAEVLTIRRSPAERNLGRSPNRAWTTPSGVATSSRTPSRPSPRASGGLLAAGVTSWVALPVLALAIGFSVLVFTGTRIKDIPTRLRELGMDPDDLAVPAVAS